MNLPSVTGGDYRIGIQERFDKISPLLTNSITCIIEEVEKLEANIPEFEEIFTLGLGTLLEGELINHETPISELLPFIEKASEAVSTTAGILRHIHNILTTRGLPRMQSLIQYRDQLLEESKLEEDGKQLIESLYK